MKNNKVIICSAMMSLMMSFGWSQEVDSVDENDIKNDEGIRTVRIRQDDDQEYMTTKIYKLKHVRSVDIAPWIKNAVMRFSGGLYGQVSRIDYENKNEQILVVTTSSNMIPWIDEMIEKLDHQAPKDRYNTVVDGTGIHDFYYAPRFRGSEVLRDVIVKGCISSLDGDFYFDNDSNFFYFKDTKSDGEGVLKWLKIMDRPLPQIELTLNVYEVSDTDLKELGVDYLSWKNGPGLNIFGAGLNALSMSVDEQMNTAYNVLLAYTNELSGSMDWAYGGFFCAPQFDASFLRMMAQKGRVKAHSSSRLSVLNGVSTFTEFSPGFQNITKTTGDITSVTSGSPQGYQLSVKNPVICFQNKDENSDASLALLMFTYGLSMKTVVGRSNLGTEIVNKTFISSDLSLNMNEERLLGAFSRDTEAKQVIGVPFFCEIPIIKYLFSTTTTIKQKSQFFVTATARPLNPDADLSPWAGRLLDLSDFAESAKEVNEQTELAVPGKVEGK